MAKIKDINSNNKIRRVEKRIDDYLAYQTRIKPFDTKITS